MNEHLLLWKHLRTLTRQLTLISTLVRRYIIGRRFFNKSTVTSYLFSKIVPIDEQNLLGQVQVAKKSWTLETNLVYLKVYIPLGINM